MLRHRNTPELPFRYLREEDSFYLCARMRCYSVLGTETTVSFVYFPLKLSEFLQHAGRGHMFSQGQCLMIAPCSISLPFSADFGHLTYTDSKVVGNEHRFPQPLFTCADLALVPAHKSSRLNHTPYCIDTHRVWGETFICIAMAAVTQLSCGG